MRARRAKFLSEPEPLPMPRAPVLPRHVALKIAKIACVPTNSRKVFCELLSDKVKSFWETPSFSSPPKPSPTLKRAAAAAWNLQRAFDELDETDRRWLETIKTL